MSKTETLIEALKKLGCQELPGGSRKYRKFTKPGGREGFYFVGRAGALRVGRIASRSSSFSNHIDLIIAPANGTPVA
jgi:hypothetical protein